MILVHDFRSHVGRWKSHVASWDRDFGPQDLFTKHLWSAKAVMHAINAVTQV